MGTQFTLDIADEDQAVRIAGFSNFVDEAEVFTLPMMCLEAKAAIQNCKCKGPGFSSPDQVVLNQIKHPVFDWSSAELDVAHGDVAQPTETPSAFPKSSGYSAPDQVALQQIKQAVVDCGDAEHQKAHEDVAQPTVPKSSGFSAPDKVALKQSKHPVCAWGDADWGKIK